MNVIPHNELTERKSTQNSLFFHIPAFLIHHCLPENRKDTFHIGTILIFRQRFESGNSNAEVLSQHLQQSDIEHTLFFTGTDDVPFGHRLANHLNRKQQDRRIAGTLTMFGFIPSQQAQSKI